MGQAGRWQAPHSFHKAQGAASCKVHKSTKCSQAFNKHSQHTDWVAVRGGNRRPHSLQQLFQSCCGDSLQTETSIASLLAGKAEHLSCGVYA